MSFIAVTNSSFVTLPYLVVATFSAELFEQAANAKVDASANAPTNFFFIKFPLQSVFFLIDVINIPQFEAVS